MIKLRIRSSETGVQHIHFEIVSQLLGFRTIIQRHHLVKIRANTHLSHERLSFLSNMAPASVLLWYSFQEVIAALHIFNKNGLKFSDPKVSFLAD
jgi:hypothetical protein